MGEILDDGPKLHDDLRLVGRAVKQRWPIPEEKRVAILSRLFRIVEENPEDEVAIKAIAQLRGMEQQNQKDEQTQLLHNDRNRFLEIATRLGIGSVVGRIASERTGNGSESVDESGTD